LPVAQENYYKLLSIMEKIIYDNTLAMQKMNEDKIANEKKAHEAEVDRRCRCDCARRRA
jgi:hypothetical protein